MNNLEDAIAVLRAARPPYEAVLALADSIELQRITPLRPDDVFIESSYGSDTKICCICGVTIKGFGFRKQFEMFPEHELHYKFHNDNERRLRLLEEQND